MNALNQRLQNRLTELEQNQRLRSLSFPKAPLDFMSNDYLGLAKSEIFRNEILAEIQKHKLCFGATGSRLLSGQSEYVQQVENEIVAFHDAEAGLLFNSGYDANVGLLSTLPSRADTILYDELSHASIREGVRLSLAKSYAFRHNDPEDLRKKITNAQGDVFVVVESIYSMDGDAAPLKDFAQICNDAGAHLVVDEAHATGVLGPLGKGLCAAQDIENQRFASVHTFGKALACQGAIVLGSEVLRKYLINFCRNLIFTTALSPAAAAAVRIAYRTFPEMEAEREVLRRFAQVFKEKTHGLNVVGGDACIFGVVCPGNEAVRQAAQTLQRLGYDLRPIVSPTVPAGLERIRINVHANHSEQTVRDLATEIQKLWATSA